MEDQAIIDLYFVRSEKAISETAVKYGGYCFSIANNILANREDAEECVSDTWLTAWRTIPPKRPSALAVFLGKITRNGAISRWRKRSAEKRGGGEITLALEELKECVADPDTVEESFSRRETVLAFNRLLGNLTETERNVFLRRYWCVDTIADIAASFGFSEGKVKSILHRTRQKLRKALEKEGLL